MNAPKIVMLVVTCIAQMVAMTSVAQTSPPLRSRIPRADPKKYNAIRDGQDWQNPKMIVRPDGIEIIGITPPARGIDIESVLDKLEHLPDSAWPYGLVVAVADAAILSSGKDMPRIEVNRTKLLKTLKQHGIAAELWPTA
jgi:hypothetical protein